MRSVFCHFSFFIPVLGFDGRVARETQRAILSCRTSCWVRRQGCGISELDQCKGLVGGRKQGIDSQGGVGKSIASHTVTPLSINQAPSARLYEQRSHRGALDLTRQRLQPLIRNKESGSMSASLKRAVTTLHCEEIDLKIEHNFSLEEKNLAPQT